MWRFAPKHMTRHSEHLTLRSLSRALAFVRLQAAGGQSLQQYWSRWSVGSQRLTRSKRCDFLKIMVTSNLAAQAAATITDHAQRLHGRHPSQPKGSRPSISSNSIQNQGRLAYSGAARARRAAEPMTSPSRTKTARARLTLARCAALTATLPCSSGSSSYASAVNSNMSRQPFALINASNDRCRVRRPRLISVTFRGTAAKT
jgi:hypothetical protein